MGREEATPIQQALDEIEKLEAEEQQAVIDIVRRRLIERRRAEIAENARATLRAFREGRARYGLSGASPSWSPGTPRGGRGEGNMELEGYFDFQAPNAIRVQGTRIDIKTVLQDYSAGASPEEIVLRYPTLSLEQVHATITYYLRHRDETERYLSQSVAEGEAAWAAQETSEFVSELRRRLDEQRRLLQVGGGQRG